MAFEISKAMPLISFHALVDEDMGILKFILANYGESSAINVDLLKGKSVLEITGEIYRRKFDNPIKLILSDEKYADLLDRCYKEFITEHEADIIDHSVTTEFLNLTQEFAKVPDIIPTILCYTQEQCDTIKKIKGLSDVNIVGPKEALENLSQYSQIYFKFLFEFDLFKEKVKNCTIYFSSVGLNLNEDNSDLAINNDDIAGLILKHVNVAIYDLYRMNLIGAYD